MPRRRYDIVLHMFDEQDILSRVDPRNDRIHVVYDEDVIEMFHRNVVIVEVHEWIHVELITPFGAELHVINLDAEEAKNVADEAYVEDDENAMQDECDSVRRARQTNEDEDDELMSGYSSDDAPLDAGSEHEGDEDEDESEDRMNNYLHKNILPHYAEMVKRSNHGSIVKLQYNHNENDDEEGLVSNIPIVPSFKRTFVGLGALKKDFLQRCGPFLGFDGCHLKGTYGCLLHPVIALDGNNGLFPLAFGVVESEFFQALDEMLGGFGVDRPWTFMSD
ncbi:UNVERIFIED_CONTAM: hypothetical protein Scaly_0587300 [Sesamum calycinum]|uniref:Transposase n=1 Tax=Sesamum calycinum TaxID=2727403 RepID=A0AAW2RRZ6_9LAMI